MSATRTPVPPRPHRAAACGEQEAADRQERDRERQAELPEGQLVSVELTPERPGEYEFTCGMGMLHGKIVVR